VRHPGLKPKLLVLITVASSSAGLAAIENLGGVHVAQNRYGYRRFGVGDDAAYLAAHIAAPVVYAGSEGSQIRKIVLTVGK
jgi:hypothetical protein